MSADGNRPEPPDFAASNEIAEYGDISSGFFELVGLGNVTFISNESRLSTIREATVPQTPLAAIHQRIRQVYRVDASDLDRLIDIFARIRSGPAYRNWEKRKHRARPAPGTRNAYAGRVAARKDA